MSPKPIVLNIITITFEDPEGFASTSSSLKHQTSYEFNWIVKDGSITSYASTLSDWCSTCTYKCSRDSGIYDAMNQGLQIAPPGWALFLNSGDVLASNDVVESLLLYLEDPSFPLSEFTIICGSCLHAWPNKTLVKVSPKPIEYCRGVFAYRLPTVHQAMIFSPSLASSLAFDTSYRITGDGEYFWRAKSKGAQIVSIPLTISTFVHGGRSMQYKGLLKQIEVFRYTRRYKLASLPILVLSGFMSALTTFGQRVIFSYLSFLENL